MTWEVKWRYIYRWWIFSVATLIIFWVVWFLIAGKVPVFNQIRIDHFGLNKTFVLPFAISRWWDIPAIIIWPFAYILIYGKKSLHKSFLLNAADGEFVGIIFANALAGFFIGGVFINLWLVEGYLIPLFIVLICFILIAIIGEISSWDYIDEISVDGFWGNILCHLAIGLSIGLGVIFTVGLIPGLIIALGSFLAITFLQFTLVKFVRLIGIFFRNTFRWLALKPKNDC